MTACQQMLQGGGSGSGIRNPLGALQANSNGSNVSASVTFRTDGGITYGTSGGSAAGPNSWFDPVLGTPGNSYWLRFTVTSGAITTNPAAAFTQLSANLTLTQTAVGLGSRNGNATIEISANAAGTAIVTTGTVNLSCN